MVVRPERLVPALGAVVIVALLLASGASPAPAATPPAHSVAAAAAHPAYAPSPQATPIGPVGGRLFAPQEYLPYGTTNSVTGLAVDPATASVFATNQFAGTVTVFNEGTGAVGQSQTVGALPSESFPSGILLDASHHRLFVSISTRFATPGAGGWLVVLNETTLATEANVTFPASPGGVFEPTFASYDAPTDQLFVENATDGVVAFVDLATFSVTKYLTCPVAICAQHPYGLVDVPSYQTLVVPTCAKALWLVNTSNDSTRALLSGPSNGALMAWAAFDSADRVLWVENYSYFGSSGTFLGYNLTTLALLYDVPGAPPRESGMSYEVSNNLLVTTNIDGSEEIETFNASTGAVVAASGDPTSTAHPFLALAVDPTRGVAIASGPGNGSTTEYALPSLSVDRVYSSFPLTQPAVATDPADGTYLVVSTNPALVRAQSEINGATAWSQALPTGSAPVGVAYDGRYRTAWVAESSSASLLGFSAQTGSPAGAYSLGTSPGGLCGLANDPSEDLVYIGSTAPSEVLAFSTQLDKVIGTYILTGYAPCRLAVDPVSHDLYVLGAPGASALILLAPNPLGLLTLVATWTLPPSAVDLAVNGAGDAWVLTDSGSTLVEVAPPSGTIVRTLDLSSTPANAIAYDPIDGFLFLDAATTAQLEAVTVARLAYAGEIPAPAPLGALAFDGTNGLVASVTAATGESEIVTLIPVPSAPTAFAAAAENNSVSLAWGPPTSAGPDPVLGYSVSAVPVNGTVPAVFENVSNLGTTVGNLTDGVAYNVSVAAYSAAGLSVQPVNATATPAGVPYPPTALAVNATGTASITLQWAAPASDDGSPVFDYVVRYVPTVGGTALTVDAGDQLNVTLVRLTPDTDYSITVTAQNAVGFGHPSASVVARTASTASTPWLLYAGVGVAAIVVAAAVVVLRVRRPKPPAPTAPAEAPSTDWVPDPPEP